MIGVIAAEEKELLEVKNLMSDIESIELFDRMFYKGKLNNKDVVCVKCGVGKVNSAHICQVMIDNFNVELVVNIGSAGGVDKRLKVGDVVIADKLFQHDFDITPFGRELGEIDNIGKFIETDKKLLEIFKDKNVFIGGIASGDKFIHEKEEKDKIRDTFNVMCVEMEGASIAQVCFLDKVKFLVIRSITDTLEGNSKVDFETFLTEASKNAANILKDIINNI